MDTTYRLRFLIYLAAFMLVMSLCFVYAEPLPATQSSPLLFQVTPQHSGFLAPLAAEPTFDPAALEAAVTPVVSPRILQQIEQAAHPHHGLFHRAKRTVIPATPSNSQTESSAQGLSLGSPVSATR